MRSAKQVEVITRNTAEKTVVNGDGNLTVSASSPSVIQVYASPQDVVRYVREGNDLIITLKDGTTVRCRLFFLHDPQTDEGSELVFVDQQGLTHVTFTDAGEVAGVAAVPLAAELTPVTSIAPFLAGQGALDSASWGWLAGAAIGGGALGALLAHGGKGESKTEVIDNTRPETVIAPTFLATDNQGDKQGVLRDGELTDDATPTFSGTGQPGSTIQIRDASGGTVASAQVNSAGQWSVTLPTQADGAHRWTVVQINGDTETAAGSLTLTVSTAAASLAVSPLSGDNLLNASEQASGFTLTGSATQLAEGTPLRITLNGKSYTSQVGADGRWSLSIPAADAQALSEGNWTVSVIATDAAGNRISAEQNFRVDTTAPTLTLATIGADNVINAAEHQAPLTLRGSTSAEPGQTVTVTLNGESWTAIVAADGSWSVTLSADRVAALAEGEQQVEISVSDRAGNTAATRGAFVVDTVRPEIVLNPVSGDDVLNLSEQAQAQIVSGRASGARAGDVVSVTLGEQTFTGIVQADGSWSVGVPASAFSAVGEGTHSLQVTVTTAAGNSSSLSHPIVLSGAPPAFTLDAIAGDNLLNAQEALQPLTLSGTSTLPDGSAAVVTLNNQQWTTTVNNGVWQLTLPVEQVLQLSNGNYSVSISGEDSAGNRGEATSTLRVDTQLPQVIISTFAGDDQVNQAESIVAQTLSGRVIGAAAGDTVTVTIGGAQLTAVVGSDLRWQVSVPPALLQAQGDGPLLLTASVTNASGNTGSGERPIVIAAGLPGLRIDTIAGDDVINALEQQQNLIVSGSSSGLPTGTAVTLTLNGVSYRGVTDAAGRWQIGVPAADVQGWSPGPVAVSASAADGAGNAVSVTHPLRLDVSGVAVTLDPVSGDDRLNAAEKQADLTLSGRTEGVEAGQTVVIRFADATFTARVQADGSWQLTVPASALADLTDGRNSILVSVTNQSGNSGETSRQLIVDTLPPTLTLDNLTDDNILNAAEVAQGITLSGTSSAEPGQQVTVLLGGARFQATVLADGSWSVAIPTDVLVTLPDGPLRISASVSDRAGNVTEAGRTGLVDATLPQVSIDNVVNSSNTINASAHGQAQVISGSVTGAAAGDRVTVELNGVSYSSVIDAAGRWSLGLPASAVSALPDGPLSLVVTVTDRAGNRGSGTQTLTVNTAVPEISVNTVAGDDVINAREKGGDLRLTGDSNQPAGTPITVTLNGINYTTVAGDNGSWQVTVPASAVQALGEASYRITASVTDAVGNSAAQDHEVRVDSTLPAVVLTPLGNNNVINAAGVAAGELLSGRVLNAAPGDTVTVILGDNRLTAQVQDDLSWQLLLPTELLSALGNGSLTLTASVTNGIGNTGSATLPLVIDAALPGLRMDTVAGDDVINLIEHQQSQVLSGRSEGLAAGTALTVTANGKTYATSVLADGSWQVGIPAQDVANWPAGPLTLTVSGESAAGNPVSIGQIVTVDLAPVAITLDPLAQDNVINAQEKGEDLRLSGSTSNVEPGQRVTVVFAGGNWYAEVDAEGNWSVTVPAASLSALPEGNGSLSVSVSNQNGNGASAVQNYRVDTLPPEILLDPIAGDNQLNATEAQQPLILSGSSTAETGQTVSVTLNGNRFTTQVSSDGRWSITLTPEQVGTLSSGTLAVRVEVSDKAGNPAQTAGAVRVDIDVPQITIDAIAGDDIINLAEHGQALIVTGRATGAEAGDVVTLTLNGKTYSGILDAQGNWRIGLTASDVMALADGETSLTAQIVDRAGNGAEASRDFNVALSVPTLTIGTVAEGDVINAQAHGRDLAIAGGSNQPAGTPVTVTLNGLTYTTTTGEGGDWSVTVPAKDVGLLRDASWTIVASLTDAAGNSGQIGHPVRVDTQLPQVTLAVIAGDDVINAAEIAAGQTLRGTVQGAEPGSTVTVTLGGNRYTAEVQPDLSWSVAVPEAALTALGDGALTVTAEVTNAVGNTGSGQRPVTIDANLPGIRISTVAGDDVINLTEHGQAQLISGTSSGLSPGSTLTVTVNGKTYPASVLADGSWQIGVTAADVAAWPAGPLTVSASGESAAGNPVTVARPVTVDLTPVSVSLDTIATQDVINGQQKVEDLLLSGRSDGVEAGQTVSISFAGHRYSARINDSGEWSLTVPAADLAGLPEGQGSIAVSVSNQNGNVASSSRDYRVDTVPPTLIIDAISGNNMLNASEVLTDLVLTGSSSAEPGQTVTVELNGEQFRGQVQSNGSWSITLPADTLGALSDGNYTFTASVTDKAGNPASSGQTVLVDVSVPGITINPVASDDVINLTEHGQALIVTGSVNNAEPGDVLTLRLNGKAYTTVLDEAGNWLIGIPAADITALSAGNFILSAALTDKAGNNGVGEHPFSVDFTAPALSINVISGDDIINSDDKNAPLTVSGTASGVPAGSQVAVTLNGLTTGATVQSDGSWQVEIPADQVKTLSDARYEVTVSASNAIGNSTTVSRPVAVDSLLPGVIISPVAGDDVINAAEVAAGQTLSGRVTGAEAGSTVTVTLGGNRYAAEVQPDLSWSVTVPEAALTALGNGALTVTATVTNAAGNTGSGSREVAIDAGLPGVRINPVAGDDVVNVLEHQQALVVSGSSSGLPAGGTLTVTVNGKTYPASVAADGG
ncbi:Ig-like domain-containing protein, partial [Pantoea sp. 1.19]|uniref:Ig-like domain-containing protein n=1 Tax=Pantoea sp. 1.19 TaxID=1925589 RepID=UPI00094917C3